jgi:undecaprenyl-diphosphatase
VTRWPATLAMMQREAALCLACNRWARRSRAARVFVLASRLGDGAVWYSLLVAIALVDGVAGLMASVHMALAGAASLTVYRVLKRHARRLRPFASDPRIRALVPPLDEYSFPSGHTLHAVAFSVVAVAHYPLLGWGLVPLCGLIAASRVVLGLHYPSDVAAGFSIGAGMGLLALLPLQLPG